MIFGFKPLEVIYLLIGSGILANEILVTQSLTTTELGAALFFFGLTAASVADREGTKGPVEFIRLVVEIFKPGSGGGSPPPSQGQGKEKDQ